MLTRSQSILSRLYCRIKLKKLQLCWYRCYKINWTRRLTIVTNAVVLFSSRCAIHLLFPKLCFTPITYLLMFQRFSFSYSNCLLEIACTLNIYILIDWMIDWLNLFQCNVLQNCYTALTYSASRGKKKTRQYVTEFIHSAWKQTAPQPQSNNVLLTDA